MLASKSFTAVDLKDYTIKFEYNKEYLILHLPRVDKMNKGVFIDMKYRLEDWYEFFKSVGYELIFAAIDPNDEKMKKLLRMLDFKLRGFADNMLVYSYGDVEWVQ